MAEGNVSGCTANAVLNNCSSHYKVLVVNTKMQLDGTQFCRAFFHVPTVLNWNIEMQCLDEENCRVIDKEKKDPQQSQPRYVVCLVVLRRGDDVKYMAMYENCVKKGQKKHAEEFFHDHAIENDHEGGLKKILDDRKKRLEKIQKKGSNNDDIDVIEDAMKRSGLDDLKLYMYITLQPCHYSIENSPDKSCTEILINLYKTILKPLHIELIVKPTFIYKAYWLPTSEEELKRKGEKVNKMNEEIKKLKKLKHKEEEEEEAKKMKQLEKEINKAKKTNMEIKNAKDGLKMLHKEDIQIEAMSEEDWDYLRDKLCHSSEHLYSPGGSYEGSEREKLDEAISKFIKRKIEEGISRPPSNSSTSTSGSDSTSSSGSD